MEKEPITHQGLIKLKKELEEIKNFKRPKIVEAIAEARAHGDLKENAEYHAAKEEQAKIEGRAIEINDQQPIVYYNRALSKARFFYTYDACLDLKKARDLGLQQANTLMMQQCGKHMAKLNKYIPDSTSK